MPDISMCANQVCPKRADCFRYLAVPSDFRQPYRNFEWAKCDQHWPLEEATGRIRTVEEVDA